MNCSCLPHEQRYQICFDSLRPEHTRHCPRPWGKFEHNWVRAQPSASEGGKGSRHRQAQALAQLLERALLAAISVFFE
jgi:hypothetical protein